MKISNLSIAGLLVLMFVAVSPVFAQSDRGGITGRVTDQTGAVVAEAKVTALNVETGETREARTNGEGNYTIPQLAAVVYRIKVEATGFKTASVENIKVAVQVIRTVDVTLEVGELTNTVIVSGEAAPYCKRKTRRHSSTLVNGKCASYHYSSLPKAVVVRRCHSSSSTAVSYQTIARQPAQPPAAPARTPRTSASTAVRD